MRRRKVWGTCPICRRSDVKLTKEDVFPTWYRNELTARSVGGQHPARIIMRICEPCNARLSAMVEHPAAPLMKRIIWEPAPADLSANEARVLLRWILKTDALLAIVRRTLTTPGLLVQSSESEERLRREVVAMLDDSSYVPPNITRVGMVDLNVVWNGSRPFRTIAAQAMVGRSWLSSVMQTGLLLSESTLVIDGGDGNPEAFASVFGVDDRFCLLDGSRAVTVPRRLDAFAARKMRMNYGHADKNVLGGDWKIAISEIE